MSEVAGGWISADRVEDKRETCHFCVSLQEGNGRVGGGNPDWLLQVVYAELISSLPD